MGLINSGKKILGSYFKSGLTGKLGTVLSSNEKIIGADLGDLVKGMKTAERESEKVLRRSKTFRGALTADIEDWSEAKWKRLGLEKGDRKNLTMGKSLKAAFLNNDGTLSKANIAGAYMGTNAIINGHAGIPIISDSDREFTGGTTSALIGGGAFALAKKFL